MDEGMQGEGDIGEIIAKVLSKIFKNRPTCAYAIFTFLIIVVLSAMLFKAQNPNDLAFPIIGLAFVFIVVLGRAIRAIRQQSIQEHQVIEQAPLDQEKPLDQEIMLPDTEEKVSETLQRKQQVVQYPSREKVNFKQVLIICVIFFALGYLFVYLFGTDYFIKLLTQIIPNLTVSEAKTDLSTIRHPIFQLICGFPCAFFAFIPILVILHKMLIRITKASIKILIISHSIISFIFGILIYGPMQLFYLFASAI